MNSREENLVPSLGHSVILGIFKSCTCMYSFKLAEKRPIFQCADADNSGLLHDYSDSLHVLLYVIMTATEDVLKQ